MSKLWDYYDGEPFMENPHLAIIGNSPKRRTKMARRKANRRRRTTRSSGRKSRVQSLTMRSNNPRRHRRRHRRNPFPVAGLVANRRHRRHRRNPAILGVTMPPLMEIAWVGGGFIATPMVEGFVNKFLPVEFATSTLGRYAIKVGSVIGLTFLVKQVAGIEKARRIALGGAAYVVVSAVNEFLPQLTGATPPATAAYRYGNIGVNAYRTSNIRGGMGAYSKTSLAAAKTGLAASSLLPRWDLGQSGMTNPVYADPRFTQNATVAR